MRVIQSLQRGLTILDYLAERRAPIRTSEVAARLCIDKASASRLLATLQASGYADRGVDRRYVLGKKLNGHDDVGQIEELIALREKTHPLLETLVDMAGECAHMAVLVADKVWYVDKVASPQVLRVDHPVGALAPLHCTALGKVFLAFGSHAVPPDLQRFTAHTLTDRTALEANLDEARQNGFASDDEEYSPGVRCVAAPIRRDDGSLVAAVGLSGPSARVDAQRLKDLGQLLGERCQKLLDVAKAA